MAGTVREILAADIGGTNSRFARFTLTGGIPQMAGSTWLETASVSTFKQLLDLLAAKDFPLLPASADFVSIAVAGPIEEGGKYCKPTQVSWDIDFRNAATDFGIRQFALINDFIAQAYACVSPIGEKAQRFLEGEPAPAGSIAVIGAGTGLGKALLVSDLCGGYIAAPSEGGHSTFSPESDREYALAKFVKELDQLPYVTWEDIVSGRGLSRIHRFLSAEDLPPEQVASKFGNAPETLAMAARLYGRAARNFALETLATGGVYIAGGVAARNPQIIAHPEFEAEFRSSRRHERLLKKIPVLLNTDQDCGLWGAGWFAAYRMGLLQRGSV